jgi:hypothetical protein
MVQCHTRTLDFIPSRQESRCKRKKLVTGHPVFFILGTAVPKAAIKQCLRNL